MSLPFFGLSEEERAGWRSSPVTVEFEKFVEFAERQCANAIVLAVRGGKGEEAKILSGKLEAIQIIKQAIAIRITPTETEPADDFKDPAALWETT